MMVAELASAGTDGEQLCDVLRPVESDREITELLLSAVSDLTGQQILQVWQSMLEFAQEHGWSDD